MTRSQCRCDNRDCGRSRRDCPNSAISVHWLHNVLVGALESVIPEHDPVPGITKSDVDLSFTSRRHHFGHGNRDGADRQFLRACRSISSATRQGDYKGKNQIAHVSSDGQSLHMEIRQKAPDSLISSGLYRSDCNTSYKLVIALCVTHRIEIGIV